MAACGPAEKDLLRCMCAAWHSKCNRHPKSLSDLLLPCLSLTSTSLTLGSDIWRSTTTVNLEGMIVFWACVRADVGGQT